jgi:hypothetical protein
MNGMGKWRTTVIVFGVLVCCWLGGAVPSAPAAPHPRLSIALPAELTGGAAGVATGQASSFAGAGRVELQARQGRGWKDLAAGPLRHGHFHIRFVLLDPVTASVRAVLLSSRRTVAFSPARLVHVRAAAAAPSPASPSTTPGASTAAVQPPSGPSAPPTESSPPVTEPPSEPPASTPTYWGAWIGPQLTGTAAPEDMGAVTKFEELAGKPLSILETFASWANCSGASASCQPTVPFPRPQFEAMRGYGAIPMYSWATEGTGEADQQSQFQLADIIAGKFDSYIRKWAGEAKAWAHPFFLRFDWEMNGDWFPWSESRDGNQAGEFAAAWRHVHDIFTEVGATNASWVWCPYVNPNGNLQSPSTFYPGDAYVDWTCLDGYNRGTTASPTAPYRSFDYLFGPNYREITETVAPTKPMLLGEVATSENGGSKAQWIEEMFAALPGAYPQVRGLLWFDYFDQGNDWPIETSPAATAAFAAGISDPRYLPNTYAASGAGPVPLP